MLVLLRKTGEEIVIGRNVVVRVARVTRCRVFLAVEAPTTVPVDRKEIRSAKKSGVSRFRRFGGGPKEVAQG